MAANVFGTPITNSTLEGMEEYAGMIITQNDRAHVALLMKNEGQNAYNAQQYVDNLKQAHGHGNGVSTRCMLYNATGDTVTYARRYDWKGHIGESPYPIEIANGQWGAFLHVANDDNNTPSSSISAVVYRGKNNNEVSCDWSFAWRTECPNPFYNIAYSEVALTGRYEANNWKWEGFFDLNVYVRTAIGEGCKISCAIGVGSSVSYVGIMTLENA